MRNKLMEAAEAPSRKSKIPAFQIGDTVTVSVRIAEGDKTRLQPYTGVVIARRGTGMGEMFTVRRIVNNEGVERVFPIHSPNVAAVKVVRSGKVHRGKLYFLRDRVGKQRRLRERRSKTGLDAATVTVDTSPGEPVGAGTQG